MIRIRNNQTYTMSSSRTSASSTATPFCKVCCDAGKPKEEYTSHYVKDQPGPNGKVVCPTLLNQACRICNKTGHTSSYCSQYRDRARREEPRREERYIEREREDDYHRRGDRREEQPRRDDSYNRLREDTERREREIRERDEAYYRQQERRSKPWLQAALKKQEPEEPQRRREPYAHPHGPRVRLNLQATALCVSKHAVPDTTEKEPTARQLPAFDVRKVQLNHAAKWGDEDTEQPFVCDEEQMSVEFLQNVIMSNLTSNTEYDFIAACDDQTQMPFNCGD